MTAGARWQIVGGALELVGLGLVALGISDTRRRFTNRPPWFEKLRRPFRTLYRKLLGKGQFVDLQVGDNLRIGSHASARLRKTTNWESLSAEEATARVREAINRHEGMLDDLAQKLDTERAERAAADEEEATAREDLRRTLESRIADAAAGGLTLESWGTGAFAFGILFTLIGVVVD